MANSHNHCCNENTKTCCVYGAKCYWKQYTIPCVTQNAVIANICHKQQQNRSSRKVSAIFVWFKKKIWSFLRDFHGSPDIKFHTNLSSRSRPDTYREMDGRTDRQTDLMKLISAFRNYANALKKCLVITILLFVFCFHKCHMPYRQK